LAHQPARGGGGLGTDAGQAVWWVEHNDLLPYGLVNDAPTLLPAPCAVKSGVRPPPHRRWIGLPVSCGLRIISRLNC